MSMCDYFNDCEHCLYYDSCAGREKENDENYLGYSPACEMFDCRFSDSCRCNCERGN